MIQKTQSDLGRRKKENNVVYTLGPWCKQAISRLKKDCVAKAQSMAWATVSVSEFRIACVCVNAFQVGI